MRRSGSLTGRSRSSTAFSRVKTAAFAPMPSASERMAADANAGDRRSHRAPYETSARRSSKKVSIDTRIDEYMTMKTTLWLIVLGLAVACVEVGAETHRFTPTQF